MFVVPVKIAKSGIDGQGVFAGSDIKEGSKVWIYKEGHDQALTADEYAALDQKKKKELDKIAYLSPWSGLWVFPPESDPAEFTNHSSDNNLSVIYDKSVSSEPYFIANKHIKAGEELTNNYHEFDQITQQAPPAWAS